MNFQTSVVAGGLVPAERPAFDAAGYLLASEDWSPRLARDLALQAGIRDLTAKHWEVIEFVRAGYFSVGSLPVMRLVCRSVGIDPASAHKLFANCRSLWRIAGLPNPGPEALSYMN